MTESLRIATDGSLFITANCELNGTTWNRVDITKTAEVLMIDINGKLKRFRASAGDNPITSWDLLNGVVVSDNSGNLPNITQITTRNHNDLQSRNAVAAHPAEAVGVLSPSSMFPQDIGKNWSAGIPSAPNIFALAYAGNGIVLAGSTNGKVYRSTDYGLTWSAGISVGSNIRSLTYVGNGIIIAGDYSNGNIYRSIDYGLTWNSVNGNPIGIHISGFAYAGNGIVIASESYGEGGGANVYRSTDYGLTWDAGSIIIPLDFFWSPLYIDNGTFIILNSCNNGVHRSTDYGLTWDAGSITFATIPKSSVYLGNGIVIVGSNGHVYRSTDYGLTWTDIPTHSEDLRALAYAGNGIVIAGFSDGSIYRSTDYGLTWNNVATDIIGDIIGSLVYAGNGILIAGDSASVGVVYRSDVSYKLDEARATPITTITAYAAGTIYSLTATPALLDFGTTDPSITLNHSGTYLLKARVNLKYNGATFAANQTVTLKLRRTNNTAADISNSSTTLTTGVVTLITETFAVVELPEIVYTTSNNNDIIQLWGDVNVIPSAGSLDAVEASIIAQKIS